MWDLEIRAQFPAFTQTINDMPLVYLDSAATTQKPTVVIDAMADYYRFHNANVHRGSHSMTAQATAKFEQARQTVADFIGAPSKETIIWTRGATESINLVAQSYARNTLNAGDEILVCETSTTPTSCLGSWSPNKLGQKWSKCPLPPTVNSILLSLLSC